MYMVHYKFIIMLQILLWPLVKHSWGTMVQGIQDHIGSLNWGYRSQLRDRNIAYKNGLGELIDANTVKVAWLTCKGLYIYSIGSTCTCIHVIIYSIHVIIYSIAWQSCTCSGLP